MSPRDADGAGGAETTNRAQVTGEHLNETQIREQAAGHLHEALSATETAEKQFHIREALQLLRIENR